MKNDDIFLGNRELSLSVPADANEADKPRWKALATNVAQLRRSGKRQSIPATQEWMWHTSDERG